MRGAAAWAGAGLFVTASALLVMRWHSAAISAPTIALGLVALFGLPVVAWLWLERHVTGRSRPLPRLVWVGVGLMAIGALFVGSGLTSVTTSTGPVQGRLPTAGGGSPLHFTAVPAGARNAVSAAFPGLVAARALTTKSRAYDEIWLRRPGTKRYALQVMWYPDNGMTLQVENLQWNTAYTPRRGRPLPLRTINRMVGLRSPVSGPYLFPGYLVYLSLRGGMETEVDRLTGKILNTGEW